MNKHFKNFFLRGMAFGGFGPIVAGIVYLILSCTIKDFTLSGPEVFIAILSTYLLAFIQAGASVFHDIERWSTAKSLLVHLLTIYLSYLLCYLVNSWIPFDPKVILIFTVIFVLAYLVIWLIIFLTVRSTGKKLNEQLK